MDKKYTKIGNVRIIDPRVLRIVIQEANRSGVNPTKAAQRMIVERAERNSVFRDLADAGVTGVVVANAPSATK